MRLRDNNESNCAEGCEELGDKVQELRTGLVFEL